MCSIFIYAAYIYDPLIMLICLDDYQSPQHRSQSQVIQLFSPNHLDIVENAKFATLTSSQIGGARHFCYIQFSHFENLPIQGSCQLFLHEDCLSSCKVNFLGLKFGLLLKAHLFIHSKNLSTPYYEICSERCDNLVLTEV